MSRQKNLDLNEYQYSDDDTFDSSIILILLDQYYLFSSLFIKNAVSFSSS